MQHRVSLDANADFLSILNTVDLGTAKGVDRGDRAKSNNLELAMRLRAASISEDNFFTDLNGFQVLLHFSNINLSHLIPFLFYCLDDQETASE
jgi:hypothetical protein